MRTWVAIQRATIQRAREFADRRGHKGGGFELCDYRKALCELSATERAIERGLRPTARASQRVLAEQHFSDEVKKYRAYGLTHAEAVNRATTEEHPALRQRRAGFEPNRSLTDGQVAMGRMFRTTTLPTKAYAGAPMTGEASKADLTFDLAARRIAADALYRGSVGTTAAHRHWADSWYGAINPAPAPGTPPDVLTAYNKAREATIDAVLDAARRLLADPAERAKLNAMPLVA